MHTFVLSYGYIRTYEYMDRVEIKYSTAVMIQKNRPNFLPQPHGDIDSGQTGRQTDAGDFQYAMLYI